MHFTVEEENLICIYHNADRRRTIGKITAVLPDMDENMRPCGRLRPMFFFVHFYAFRTVFRWVYDKSSHHLADHARKAPEYRAF